MRFKRRTSREVGLALLLLCIFAGETVLAQQSQQRNRRVVEPINLTFPSKLEGIDTPVEESFIYSSDGLYIAAVVMRPQGKGPFPAVVVVHGAPGGRGMSALKQLVQNRGMVVERCVEEGYVAIYCDYRGQQIAGKEGAEEFSYAADVVSVIRYTKQLPYVDSEKVCVYSGSLGSESSVLALGVEPVAAAVLNAPAGFTFMQVSREISDRGKSYPEDMLPEDMMDKEVAVRNLGKIDSPVLFVVGTEDRFLPAVKRANAVLNELGKDSSVDFYPNMRHGFYFGPSKVNGKYEEPTSAFTKALDKAVRFFGDRIK